ncbi:hypothetical protein [Actinocatenispora rupis]|uniref:hypothetical protein n=1 Tax=Actinocatenispora rupis TaxID=519421 RepID=UPI0019416814|nr:hypothetical protein [Actinocatenispora rupis]
MNAPDTPNPRPEPPRPADGSGGPAAPMWPARQNGGDPAMPVLGAPPPAITPPADPAAGQAPAQTADPRHAAPRPGAPQQGPTAAPTAATTRLNTDRLPADTAVVEEAPRQWEAGATILLGSSGQTTARSQAVAVPKTQGAAAAAAGQPPSATDQGTIYGGGNGPRTDSNGRTPRRVRSLAALRVGSHMASSAALDEIRVSAAGSGLLLGHDRDSKPVQVRLFRPEATRVTLLGGLWASRLLAFRALGLGARVVVFTSRPDQWDGFGQWATGRSDRVAVLPAERPVALSATPRTPALLIYDVGLLGAANRPVLGPWQTQLTVLHQLTAYGFPAVQEANLVMMQRLHTTEALSVGSVLRLTDEATRLLTALRDDMLALVGASADRYVWTNPTAIEQQRFGAPHR